MLITDSRRLARYGTEPIANSNNNYLSVSSQKENTLDPVTQTDYSFHCCFCQSHQAWQALLIDIAARAYVIILWIKKGDRND